VIEIKIKNEYEMADFAKKIANITNEGDIIGLKGSLGVGKSFFARNFINYLSSEPQNVASPTFNLLYSYQTKIGELFHFDLYRVKNFFELENIGFFDYIKEGTCLIEWPEIVAKYLEKKYLEIEISSHRHSESQERIIILRSDKYWHNKISLIF
jgi:tRNA threonylcarbamoyladenosine biosynthesis protein TsaE